ncbi:MAG: arginine--tRNA ligase [Phycisphaeraceae bacterium]
MSDLQTTLAHRFSSAITQAFGPQHAATDPLIRPSGNLKFGDYQANVAMSLGKTLGAKPREVAEKIKAALDLADLCDKVEIAGPGFINLGLRTDFIAAQLHAVAADELLGISKADPPQKVVIDYSGPNVAKEMHVGHLRSTVIGDSLARVLEYLGHDVIRQNHLGDWGTQFGMLIEHLVEQHQAADSHHLLHIADLNALYKAAKKRFDDDPAFAQRARQRVVALQGGDPQTRALWQALIEESKHHFNAIYQQLDVLLTDDHIRAESFYNPTLGTVVEELVNSGLAKESQGALCVFPPGFTDADGKPRPLIIRKSDGGYGYGTTDLAGVRFRVFDLDANRIIYVVDSRQKDHLAMVFQTAHMAGWTLGRRVEHVAFGTVLGEDNRPFKTRSGETVKLADLLNEAKERALKVVTEKNPELDATQRQAVARAVGIGAIKYADLANDRVKDYVFSWERMLAFDGNTAPYLQNAYVRIRSIFRKAGASATAVSLSTSGAGEERGMKNEERRTKNEERGTTASVRSSFLVSHSSIAIADPAERALALKLLQFPGVVAAVADALEPHRLCNYLYELASLFHSFYEQCPVLAAPDAATRQSRLALCDLTARTLRTGLLLLGIDVVEQM